MILLALFLFSLTHLVQMRLLPNTPQAIFQIQISTTL